MISYVVVTDKHGDRLATHIKSRSVGHLFGLLKYFTIVDDMVEYTAYHNVVDPEAKNVFMRSRNGVKWSGCFIDDIKAKHELEAV